MEPTEIELMERYHHGDNKSLEQIIARHTPRLHYFVARLVGLANADDIVQEVWIKVWRYSRRFDPKKNFKAWLFSIAKNTCYDFLRKKQPLTFSSLQNEESDVHFEESLVSQEESALDLVAQGELALQLGKALDIFPLATRIVFDMHYKEELSLVEIAEVLGESTNTVKSRHLRGLRLLREYFEKEGKMHPLT